MARDLGAAFKKESKFHGEVAKAGGVWLLKPLTFMNKSGQAVGALCKFYQIQPNEILVAHDEMDLPPGGLKLKTGGAAGSNGVKDLVSHVGTRDFWRLRIGIGHPGVKAEVVNWVLKKPMVEDKVAIDACIARSLEAVPMLLGGEMEKATMLLHTKPPRQAQGTLP